MFLKVCGKITGTVSTTQIYFDAFLPYGGEQWAVQGTELQFTSDNLLLPLIIVVNGQ
ncbi:hypothetical protein ACJROX_08290 [Pseudalkalibacillus sp. A8]|uniref:hypothetical protein n=1 Tax=Pseudalkalibacillus sp. A8 TaxID=3382641 RepID=UPI0038B63746